MVSMVYMVSYADRQPPNPYFPEIKPLAHAKRSIKPCKPCGSGLRITADVVTELGGPIGQYQPRTYKTGRFT